MSKVTLDDLRTQSHFKYRGNVVCVREYRYTLKRDVASAVFVRVAFSPRVEKRRINGSNVVEDVLVGGE